MKAIIVPALPTERAQYERWYQMGLEAMTAAANRLRAQKRTQPGEPVSWFPQFTVRCGARGADQQVATIVAAANQLTVQPNQLRIDHEAVELTFALDPTITTALPAWQPSEGALWRLYDGLLSNLVGSLFQPVLAIKVGLRMTGMATPATRQLLRPSFSQYGAASAAAMQVTVIPTPSQPVTYTGTQGADNGAKLFQLKNYHH